MPSESCKNHFQEYLETKLAGKQWSMPTCCLEHYQFEKPDSFSFQTQIYWEDHDLLML